MDSSESNHNQLCVLFISSNVTMTIVRISLSGNIIFTFVSFRKILGLRVRFGAPKTGLNYHRSKAVPVCVPSRVFHVCIVNCFLMLTCFVMSA
jgi:hypothetical protein